MAKLLGTVAKETVLVCLYDPDICLKRLEKTTKLWLWKASLPGGIQTVDLEFERRV
jgi:hypothetical protein